MSHSRLVVLSLVTLAACEDVPLAYELDHARVMAVRVDPPAIAAAERTRIDVLVTDATGGPRVADAARFAVTAPGGLELGTDATGWYAIAPDADELARLRAALGVAPESPLIVPLDLVVESDAGPLFASKTLALDATAQNPPAPAILLDGAPGPFVMQRGDEVELTATGDPELSYRWFSSVGELTGFTRSAATLEPNGEAGMLGVVVRDQAGGVAWTLAPAEVVP